MFFATLRILCQHVFCNLGRFMLTSAQCRAARALVDWSREMLSERSKVSHRSIVDFERGAREPRVLTKEALARALEAAGVEFIPENGGGAGVRLKKGGKID
ncbi:MULTISPECIES: helix-turn-helix transcriptional regulator [unclassified Mesorhizobium]|nr:MULTISPECIES: helix-turn-helix transcriptional regulator [unclassified Mesorhizobium]